MTDHDTLKGAAERIHDVVQQCMADGLLEEGMLQDWFFIGTTIRMDGDSGIIVLSPETARASSSLGLISMADEIVRQEIRDWHGQ